MIWAVLMCVVLLALIGFQIALAAGAPLGRFAWGGQHPGTLPRRLRIASAVSTLVYVGIGLVALSRVGALTLVAPPVAALLAWLIFGYLCLGVVMNAASRSRGERAVMTPIAAVMAACALGVALS